MEHCGRTGADLRRAGKNGLRGIARFADPDESADDTFTRILPSPRHIPLVVAGARNAAISMVVRVFGEWSGTATPVEQVPAAAVEVLVMIDAERAGVLASTLAADGYHMEVAEAGDRVRVTIIATPQACADCLVPKDLMRGILGQAFGVPPDAIDLTYPSTSEQER